MLKQKENYNFMKRKITKYDKTEVYKKEIAPIISDLKVACTFAGLPMFVTVAIKNDDKTGTTYESNIVQASLMHMNGFPVDYPDYIKEDIRELRDYLDEIEKTMNEGDAIDIDLKENRLTEMNEIVAGKKKTVVPDKLLKKDIHIDENI